MWDKSPLDCVRIIHGQYAKVMPMVALQQVTINFRQPRTSQRLTLLRCFMNR